MRLRLSRRVLLGGALLGFGCYSPTLPLPPPLEPNITLTDTGAYRLQGGALPGAPVFALDSRTALIDGQTADGVGLYDFVLHEAQAGDTITLWYEAGTDLSPSTVFALPDAAHLDGDGVGGSAGSPAANGAAGATPAGAGGVAGSAG